MSCWMSLPGPHYLRALRRRNPEYVSPCPSATSVDTVGSIGRRTEMFATEALLNTWTRERRAPCASWRDLVSAARHCESSSEFRMSPIRQSESLVADRVCRVSSYRQRAAHRWSVHAPAAFILSGNGRGLLIGHVRRALPLAVVNQASRPCCTVHLSVFPAAGGGAWSLDAARGEASLLIPYPENDSAYGTATFAHSAAHSKPATESEPHELAVRLCRRTSPRPPVAIVMGARRKWPSCVASHPFSWTFVGDS